MNGEKTLWLQPIAILKGFEKSSKCDNKNSGQVGKTEAFKNWIPYHQNQFTKAKRSDSTIIKVAKGINTIVNKNVL